MRLSTEKKLLTVIVGLFSLKEKAPTKNCDYYFQWPQKFGFISISPKTTLSPVLDFVKRTNRELQKSAPYLRLKNSKRTWKCQVFFYSTQKNPKVGSNWRAGTLWEFPIFLSENIEKIEGGPFEDIKNFRKVSQCRKNWKRGPFGIFVHPFCRKTSKNWRETL